jgi:multidrug transporter EmrE-like cation transporter
MKKNKSTRRKAIDCTLVRASESNPGYFKYIITIQESNGDIVKQPAYGIDMQDAISRLVWSERTEKVTKVTNKPNILNLTAVLVALVLVVPSSFSIYLDTPYPILGAIIVILSAFGGAMFFKKYLGKGNFEK